MRAAWDLLRHWGMTAVPHHRRPNRSVLRVTEQPNSRMTAFRSEVLAIGVALEVGIRLYDTAYPFWAATEGLQAFDLQATDDAGNQYRVEARGRIDRTNVGTAKKQVYDKFVNANFSQAAGVIFFPRTNNRGREDILVLDPDGDLNHLLANSRYRNLLRHYAPLFIAQGPLIRPFGDRLLWLAKASDTDFANYMSTGDEVLMNRRTRSARSGYGWRGVQYVGTFFEDFAWPNWLLPVDRPTDGGVFFWGIAKDVVVSLQTGAVRELRFVVAEQATVHRSETTMAIVMPDRTLLVWGLTMKDLEGAEDKSVQNHAASEVDPKEPRE